MDIRPATVLDIPRVLDLSAALVTAIDGPQQVDRAYAGARVAELIQSPQGLVLLSPDGFIAARMSATMINPEPIACEMGWFARDGHGLRLLRRFEEWSDAQGATLKVLSTRGGDFTVLGYRLKEEAWVK